MIEPKSSFPVFTVKDLLLACTLVPPLASLRNQDGEETHELSSGHRITPRKRDIGRLALSALPASLVDFLGEPRLHTGTHQPPPQG